MPSAQWSTMTKCEETNNGWCYKEEEDCWRRRRKTLRRTRRQGAHTQTHNILLVPVTLLLAALVGPYWERSKRGPGCVSLLLLPPCSSSFSCRLTFLNTAPSARVIGWLAVRAAAVSSLPCASRQLPSSTTTSGPESAQERTPAGQAAGHSPLHLLSSFLSFLF